MKPAPCQCGHRHASGGCPECDCASYCPDYVAQAREAGVEPSTMAKASTVAVRESIRWTRPGLTEHTCTYCRGQFRSPRSHARTCSGACRVALHRALAHDDDHEVPGPALRRDCYARDRAVATGRGLLTRGEQYEADIRVRAAR